MSKGIIQFGSDAGKGVAPMRQTQRCQERHLNQEVCVLGSHHISSRIYYPAFVSIMNEKGFMPHASAHAFDALYQNALGFLEKLNDEEIFQ